MNRDPERWARLGQALASARRALGLTQEELAARANVGLGSVKNAEAGVVPKARMPYTIPAIAKALGWPDGAVDSILDGGAPPGGWVETSVQKQVDEARLEADLTHANVRALGGASGAEIEAATKAALDVPGLVAVAGQTLKCGLTCNGTSFLSFPALSVTVVNVRKDSGIEPLPEGFRNASR